MVAAIFDFDMTTLKKKENLSPRCSQISKMKPVLHLCFKFSYSHHAQTDRWMNGTSSSSTLFRKGDKNRTNLKGYGCFYIFSLSVPASSHPTHLLSTCDCVTPPVPTHLPPL